MSDLKPVEILLVEDSSADAEMTIRVLNKRNVTNAVVWVKDGAEALDFIYCKGEYAWRTDSLPKLVLLDIKMPKVNGIEVLRQLKSEEATRFIPIVMLTSSAEDRDLLECYSLGVNSYLVKPVDFGHFAEVISTLGLYWTAMNRLPS